MRKLEKYFNGISNITAIIGGAIVYLLGGWDTLIIVLVTLMCMDYITGVLKSLYNKKLSSNVGRKGIIKKVTTLVIVSVAVMCEKVGIPAMREITIMFFTANEGLSILENASEMGLPMPERLKSALIQVREPKKEVT